MNVCPFHSETRSHWQRTRYVARWNACEPAPDASVKRAQCGRHELGSKVSHGPVLKSLKEAPKQWTEVYQDVSEHPPEAFLTGEALAGPVQASPKMTVARFLREVSERDSGMLGCSFVFPFFGEITIAKMNDLDRVKALMRQIADGSSLLRAEAKLYSAFHPVCLGCVDRIDVEAPQIMPGVRPIIDSHRLEESGSGLNPTEADPDQA